MNIDNLRKILDDHKRWLGDVNNGKCANLLYANLSRANLSRANLSGAKGLLYAEDFIAKLESTDKGIIAYKQLGNKHEPPSHWVFQPNSELTEVVNPDRCSPCACGVNVAKKDWVDFDKSKPLWKVLIPWIALADVVVPFNTDGKFRCGRCILLEELKEW